MWIRNDEPYILLIFIVEYIVEGSFGLIFVFQDTYLIFFVKECNICDEKSL